MMGTSAALRFPGGTSGREPICQCRRDREMQVGSLAWEDSLEEEMATHSSILAWRIPWTEEPGGSQPIGSQRVGHDRAHRHGAAFTLVQTTFLSLGQ